MALVSGQPFFGHKVKERVGIVILAAEGADTFGVRLKAARIEARDKWQIADRAPTRGRKPIERSGN